MVSRIMLRKTRRDLMQNKLALLGLLAIMTVGIGTFISMAAVYRDLNGARVDYYRDYRLADFTVDMKRGPEWCVDLVRSLPNVREARGRIFYSVRIDLPGLDEPLPATAISLPEERTKILNDVRLTSGSWLSGLNDNEVILNSSFAEANGLRPGSRIKVLLADKEHDLLVVGTAMSPEFVVLIPSGGGFAPDPARFGLMYLGEEFLQESCDLRGSFNQVIGVAHDTSRTALDNTLELIEDKLDPFGVTNTTPIHEQQSASYLKDELHGLKQTSRIMPAIFLAVAALVLNILVGRMVVQQRSVIGTLKAIGYSLGTIIRHYIGYGVVIGLAAGLTGTSIGIVLQSFYIKIYRQYFIIPGIDLHLYFDIILTAVGLSVGFSILGVLKGAVYAAKLQPAEAMRPAPPEKGGSVLLERAAFVWNALSFRWKMVFRSIFRNPFRSTVSILASVISTAMILATLSLVDSLDYLMDYEFNRIAHQDYTVSLRDPGDPRASGELLSLPGISETESQLRVPCDISNGPFKKRLGVTGLPRNNILYTPLDNAGQPVTVPDTGLILTRKLAEILQLRPGDRLRLRPLIGTRTEVYSFVAGIVDTFFGLTAYADIDYLSRLIGEESTPNAVLARAFSNAPRESFLSKLKERPSVLGIGERTRSLDQLHETFGKIMGTWISILVLFAGLIAFGSVLNVALVSLSERRREVGTLRVIGYSQLQVACIFSFESYLLSGLGILLGLGCGIGLARLLSLAYDTELYRFPAIIYPSRILYAAVLMAAFISVAQVIIYKMIGKVKWAEVSRIKE